MKKKITFFILLLFSQLLYASDNINSLYGNSLMLVSSSEINEISNDFYSDFSNVNKPNLYDLGIEEINTEKSLNFSMENTSSSSGENKSQQQALLSTTFTGTGNWSSAGNWDNGLPGALTNVIIDGTCSVDGSYTVAGLTINNGKVLSITPGFILTATGTLTNNAGTSGLVLLSNASGTGMLMNNTDGVQATVNQYLVKDQWHYIGIPVSYVPDANTVFHNCYLAFMDESYAYSGLESGWQYLAKGDPLRKMHGYAVQYNTAHSDNDTIITFTGVLNTGTIDTIFNSETEGWNFVSNPYPVTINWDAAGAKDLYRTNDAIHVWNPNLNSGFGDYGSYGSYVSGGSTNGQTQYIAPMQGFYVEVWHVESGLTLYNDAKVNQNVSFKSAEIIPQIRLAVTDNNINFDEMLLREITEATATFDSRYDARKLKALNSKQPLIYSVLNNKEYSINSIPEITEDLVLPLEILIKTTGEHRLILKEMLDFSKTFPVVLLDENESFLKDLSTEDYIFTAQAGETVKLKLAFSTKTRIEDKSEKSEISVYSKGNNLIINGLKNIPSEIKIFNSTGQVIFDDFVNATTVPVTVNQRGMYIVSVLTGGKSICSMKTIVSF